MSLTLVDPKVASRWNNSHKKGDSKRFPSLDLVRLEKWYFGENPGKLLDYGFGTGVNLMYLAERGYTIEGLDASVEAEKVLRQKLQTHADISGRIHLGSIDPDAVKLPYAEGTFDYVVCVSVLSLLSTRERISLLLGEFFRVMKSGAKMIVDINGHTSDFASKGKLIGDDIYEYRGASESEPVHCYCPDNEKKLLELLGLFKIDDVGFAGHRYMGSEIFEYIACVRKP